MVMITGAGDSLQGIKRGILELAHAVVINKADGTNAAAAEKARRELENALSLMSPPEDGWRPTVMTCSALELTGLPEIWEMVLSHRRTMETRGALARRRAEQALDWMWAIIEDGLSERFRNHPDVARRIPQLTDQVRRGQVSATQAARQLLLLLDNNDHGDTNFFSF